MIRFFVVEFLERDGGICSMAIKADHYPNVNEVEDFLKFDMAENGYDHVYNFYEVDEDEVHAGYNDEGIDNWPILGKDNPSEYPTLADYQNLSDNIYTVFNKIMKQPSKSKREVEIARELINTGFNLKIFIDDAIKEM